MARAAVKVGIQVFERAIRGLGVEEVDDKDESEVEDGEY